MEVAFTTVLTEAASSQEETVSSKSVPLTSEIHLMKYDIQLTLRVAWDDSTYLWLAQVNISININKNIGFI